MSKTGGSSTAGRSGPAEEGHAEQALTETLDKKTPTRACSGERGGADRGQPAGLLTLASNRWPGPSLTPAPGAPAMPANAVSETVQLLEALSCRSAELAAV